MEMDAVTTFDLSPHEARVLGSLIEKEHTTPDYYPLTLNALISACNQKSSREPVMQLDEHQVLRAIDLLRDRQFAWMVQLVDSRVPKFEQNFSKKLNLTEQEVAVLCLLMLRGPQTVGELRARSARIYPFDTMEEVVVTLETLLEREEAALVIRLPLQPGRKETRYAHLLNGEPELPEITEAVPQEAPAMPPLQDDRIAALVEEVSGLRERLTSLEDAFQTFKDQFE